MESESKSKRLYIRLSNKEFNKLQELAKRSGKASMSAYVLECSLKNKPANEELKLQGEAKKDVRELTHQLYKIGTNLNQLTRLANTEGIIVKDLDQVLNELTDTVKKINELL